MTATRKNLKKRTKLDILRRRYIKKKIKKRKMMMKKKKKKMKMGVLFKFHRRNRPPKTTCLLCLVDKPNRKKMRQEDLRVTLTPYVMVLVLQLVKLMIMSVEVGVVLVVSVVHFLWSWIYRTVCTIIQLPDRGKRNNKRYNKPGSSSGSTPSTRSILRENQSDTGMSARKSVSFTGTSANRAHAHFFKAAESDDSSVERNLGATRETVPLPGALLEWPYQYLTNANTVGRRRFRGASRKYVDAVTENSSCPSIESSSSSSE